MGGAVTTLSETEGGVVAKYLRTNLDRYEALELSEEEIREKLMIDFNEIKNDIMASKPVLLTDSPTITKSSNTKTNSNTNSNADSNTNTVEKPEQKGRPLGKPLGNPRASNKSGSVKGPVMVRRRSFGSPSDIVNVKNSPVAKKMQSASTAEIEVVQPVEEVAPTEVIEQQIDSWDSVSEQPFCNICAMAFKTRSNYDRHVKYSDLHINNVAKMENALKAEADAVAISLEDPEKVLAEKRSKQVEGEDYRLLYSGSKFFWQSQETIDIQIYHHMLCNCLEVIAYDLQRNKELQRVYLSYPNIMAIVLPSVIKQVDAERQSKKEQNRFANLVDRDLMIEDASRHAFITFILNHLKYSVTKTEGQEVVSSIILSLTESELESIAENPVFTEAPKEVVPVHVAHRRRTSTEEITSALNNLDQDRAALKADIDRAERISDLLNKAAAMFQSNRYAGMSKYKIKWQKSIRKVIFIKAHQKAIARLDELKLSYISK